MKSNKILIIILYMFFAITGCKSNSTNFKNQNNKKEEIKKTNNISKEDQELVTKMYGLMLMMFGEMFKNTKKDIDPQKIYGSWICSQSAIEDGHEMKNLTYTFNIDGAFNGSVEYDGKIHKNNGRFELNGNTLKIIQTGAEVKVVKIEFTNDKMIFTDGLGSITFSRI